jgi:hypothetical protein
MPRVLPGAGSPAIGGEPEAERSDAEHGEADRVESTERSEEGQEGRESEGA